MVIGICMGSSAVKSEFSSCNPARQVSRSKLVTGSLRDVEVSPDVFIIVAGAAAYPIKS
jgi:hypothetical protein